MSGTGLGLNIFPLEYILPFYSAIFWGALTTMNIKLKGAQTGHSLLKRKNGKTASFSLAEVTYIAGDISYQVQESAKNAQLRIRIKQEMFLLPIFENYMEGGNATDVKRLYVYCFECNNYIYDFEFEEIKKLADIRAAEDESIEKEPNSKRARFEVYKPTPEESILINEGSTSFTCAGRKKRKE
ncbi:9719_t:CDS:2 [Entrophospora sp. SA101]|nr:9719_t:CDS:2 [Entrophospora sp. SA101]